MTLSIFGNFDAGTVVMIVLAILIAVYLYFLEKRDKQDSPAALCKQYETLTEESLAAIPDDQLLRAVAANLMNKQDRRHPDLSVTLPLLSPGRCGVYSVWLLCHELERRELGAYFRTPYRRFAELAATGFSLIGANDCAEAMTAACQRYAAEIAKDKQELPSWEDLTARLRQAIHEEQPFALCVAYIRDNPAEFTDC